MFIASLGLYFRFSVWKDPVQFVSYTYYWSLLIVIVKAHQAEVELGDCVDFNPEENHPWNCVNQKDTDRLKVLCFILLIVQQNYVDYFEELYVPQY